MEFVKEKHKAIGWTTRWKKNFNDIPCKHQYADHSLKTSLRIQINKAFNLSYKKIIRGKSPRFSEVLTVKNSILICVFKNNSFTPYNCLGGVKYYLLILVFWVVFHANIEILLTLKTFHTTLLHCFGLEKKSLLSWGQNNLDLIDLTLSSDKYKCPPYIPAEIPLIHILYICWFTLLTCLCQWWFVMLG